MNRLLTVLVLQELWEVEELWDELLDVVGVVHQGLPRGRDGVELTVGAVEPGAPAETPHSGEPRGASTNIYTDRRSGSIPNV